MTEDEYPEHKKMTAAIKAGSQAIGEFIAWLRDEQGVHFITYDKQGNPVRFRPTSIEAILGLYFDIDLKKIDEEKRMMLARAAARTT